MKLTATTTKILDLALIEVGDEFCDSLSGNECYRDIEVGKEHLYSPYDLREKQDAGEISVDSGLLDEIFLICEKKNCSYFRIIS